MSIQFDPAIHAQRPKSKVGDVQVVLQRLTQNIERDEVVQRTTHNLRRFLDVDRVVLYYFYSEWEGQVTFESLRRPEYSIFGSTGPDQCFNDEYAALYLAGRVRAIADITTAPIEDCHRDFLLHLGVRANLVVPIVIKNTLWGLLVAHHCDGPKEWSEAEIQRMQKGASVLTASISLFGE